jgi:hypothetical protein
MIDGHAQQTARKVFHLHEFQPKTGDCRIDRLCCTHAFANIPFITRPQIFSIPCRASKKKGR